MPDAAVNISIWGHQIPVLIVVGVVALAGTIIGALIASIITLFGNYLSNRQETARLKLQLQHDFEKEHFARRQNLLEKTAEDFEKVHNLVAEASALLRIMDEKDTPEKTKADYGKRVVELYDVHGPFDKELSALIATEGKLLLVGYNAASKKLSEYRQSVVQLLPEVVEAKSPIEEKVEKHFTQLNKLRDEFYKLLSNHYCEKHSSEKI